MVDDDVHGRLLAERISHVITETFAIDIGPRLITPALGLLYKDPSLSRPIESMGMRRATEMRESTFTSSAYVGASKLLELVSFNQVAISPVQMETFGEDTLVGWLYCSIRSQFYNYPEAGEFYNRIGHSTRYGFLPRTTFRSI